MVFCSCKKTTTTSTTTTTATPTKRSFPLFRRKPTTELAYLTTELDGTSDSDLPPTPAQLSQFKSVKKSKAHVDGVFYRNRASGAKTLQTGDGVLMFAGFRDWVSRKRLRERQMRGERFNCEEDTEGLVKSEGEKETIMIERVKRIDPVKSGFMGKKTDRDETTGCGAGKFAAKFVEKREVERSMLVTPRKGADDSTAATGCSPLSSNGSVERPGDVEQEDGWCGAFNSLSTSPQSVTPEDKDETASATAAEEEAGWFSVFNSPTMLSEEEGEFEVANEDEVDDDEDEDSEDDDGECSTSSEEIQGIRNVEVVYSGKKSRGRVSRFRFDDE